MTEAEAGRLARTPLYFADGLVRLGVADGCVAGACHTTGDVLRALAGPGRAGRTACGRSRARSTWWCRPSAATEMDEVLTFTDCAVVPYPTVEQLADIAIAAARDRRRIVGDEPGGGVPVVQHPRQLGRSER